MTDDGFSAIRPGTLVLARYEIRERIARGGFAVVWKAHDRLLGKDVALKILQSSIAEDPAAVEELKRETLRSRELTHPHIVQTYDFVQDGDVVGLAMELVDGATMATLAAQRPNGCFNPRDIAAWMADVCDALDYAHSERGGKKPVIHHDLKPSNFIVDRFGTAKVLDFGIAKGVAETRYQHTGQFAVVGTPPYMSPQQLLGQRPRPTDDIYSLGATIYSLLTSKPPFYRGDLAMQIGQEVPPTMNRRRAELQIDEPPIPQEWEETVVACLAKDPALRPATMNEVAVRLGVREPSTRRVAPAGTRDGAAKGARTEPTPRGTTRRMAAPKRQRSRAWLVMIPAAALAAAILLWPGDLDGLKARATRPARVLEPRAMAEFTPPATLADASGFAMTLPSTRAAFDAMDARDRAAKEHAERVDALRNDVAAAMREGSWDAAELALAALAAEAPGDPEAAKWTGLLADERAVRELLERYRAAQEALDADAYRSLWVGLDDAKLDALRRSYTELTYLSMKITNVRTRIGTSTATVSFLETLEFDLDGIGRQFSEARTTLTLQRRDGGWRIAARTSES